jgi:Zn-finger nucleic acid-binding protein
LNVPDSIDCPHCGKPTVAKVAFCPHCGGKIAAVVSKVLDPMCPRCRAALTHSRDRDVETESCSACGGLWLDRSGFHHAQREPPNHPVEEFVRPGLHTTTDPYLPCVRCGELMTKKNFGRISGVIIDECGRHGVWLDAGELEHIRQFVADGGLDRTQDVAIEKNAEALRQLATQVGGVKFFQTATNYWNPLRWFFGN